MAEKKRGNGEGSKARKRLDGRWEARCTDSEGRRRSVYAETRKEVAVKLAEALANKEELTAFVPIDITVGEFFEQYQKATRTALSAVASKRTTT